jgi:hypothetical protein
MEKDKEDIQLEYAARIIKILEPVLKTRTENHMKNNSRGLVYRLIQKCLNFAHILAGVARVCTSGGCPRRRLLEKIQVSVFGTSKRKCDFLPRR